MTDHLYVAISLPKLDVAASLSAAGFSPGEKVWLCSSRETVFETYGTFRKVYEQSPGVWSPTGPEVPNVPMRFFDPDTTITHRLNVNLAFGPPGPTADGGTALYGQTYSRHRRLISHVQALAWVDEAYRNALSLGASLREASFTVVHLPTGRTVLTFVPVASAGVSCDVRAATTGPLERPQSLGAGEGAGPRE